MPDQTTVLITGATGNIGPHIAAQLLETGVAVRALVLPGDPNASRLSDEVEIFAGDLADPASLGPALDGVDAVMLMWPFFTLDVTTAPEVLRRIAGQARRVVFVSSIGVEIGLEPKDNRCHSYLESLIEETDLEWTFLRTTGFAVNAVLSWRAQILGDGVVRAPYGQAARSPIHEADLAAVAVRALTEDGHAGARYVVTGPEALTQVEQLRILGEALGLDLRWEEVPASVALGHMVAAGWPAAYAEGAMDYFAMLVDQPEMISNHVEQVTGQAPRTFREWAGDRVGLFR